LHSDCAAIAIAQRLRSDYAAIKQRLRSDCVVIARRLWLRLIAQR
jgi:hypothetical protein